jgi:hypothetical protein
MSVERTERAAELEAMKTVDDVLTSLSPDVKGRVLRWVAEVHGMSPIAPDRVAFGVPTVSVGPTRTVGATTPSSPSQPAELEDLATVYDRARPDTDAERALVCGYWIQFLQGQVDFTAQAVNSELKNLGHGVSNITNAFSALIAQRPSLVMQVRKDGNTQQARKKYRLTSEGKKFVEAKFREVE